MSSYKCWDIACTSLIGKTMFLILETCEKLGSFWKHGLFCRSVLNLLGNIFTPWEANFVSATMFPEVDKQRKIDRKHNVFSPVFPTDFRVLVIGHLYLIPAD